MKILYIIFFIVCIIAYIIRMIYEILKYKKIITNINLFVYIIITIDMITLWVSWFQLSSFDPIKLKFPILLKYSGLFLFIIGTLLFLLSLIKIRGKFEYNEKLITTGIYSILRHPMYLGYIFWIIGYPLFMGALVTMISSIIFILNIILWIIIEERMLLNKYDGYKDYKKRTII